MQKKEVIKVKGDILIKVQTKDIIEKIQKGLLYMNSLEWYRRYEKEESDEVVGDTYEAMLYLNDAEIIIPELDIDVKVKDELLATKNSDDFVFCMFGINSVVSKFTFNEKQKREMQKFGDTALIILDSNEFKRRVDVATKAAGYNMFSNFVNYYDEKCVDLEMIKSLVLDIKNIAFWKRDNYDYQQEYRFLVSNNGKFKGNHIELNIGDISDISKVVELNKILSSEIYK